MTEPQKQAFKLKAASEAALKLEGEAAVKRIEAEKHPIPPPAMVDDKIPPPGTVYSVDKHGRVHQVR